MFTELPRGVQEKIFDSLHVKDRAKLNMALPKPLKFTKTIKTSKDVDKKLGVIANAFKKNRIKRVNGQLKSFLLKINEDDPTIQDIVQQFPELKPLYKTKTSSSIIEQIRENNIQDLDDITNEELNDEIYTTIVKHANVATFQALHDHKKTKAFIQLKCIDTPHFCLDLIFYSNTNLLEYMLSHEPYNMNKDKVLKYIVSMDLLKLLLMSFNREVFLKYFDVSKDLLENVYVNFIEEMNIEAAIAIDNYIKRKP